MLLVRPLSFLLRWCIVLALTHSLGATWSIIIVNVRTGEIAIGSATCLQSWDLRQLASVVVVGKGAAAAQSFVQFSGANRVLLFSGLKQGLAPTNMLAALARSDPGHQTRQYGIVDTRGRALGFTGTRAGAWAGHVTGRVGDLVYAIQGNVLTGKPVVDAAVAAVINTKGDLATKLMAGMQAARRKGGDGRCSCGGNPTGCGSPPKNFKKSAHIGYMVVARPGDKDGTCSGAAGCANGSYYMKLDVIRNGAAPDPVAILQGMFDTWRKSWIGRPDHYLSTVEIPSGLLPADGKTKTTVRVVLSDWTGNQLTRSGAKVNVAFDKSNPLGLTVGQVQDLGNGMYSVPLTAGTKTGVTDMRVTVDDGKGPVLLSPATRITLTADKLWVSADSLSVGAGGDLAFVMNQGVASKGRLYVLLASNSGTRPGVQFGQIVFPLNVDPVFWAVYLGAANRTLPGFLGKLDPAGRQVARLKLPAGSYGLPMGTDLHFASGLLLPVGGVTNPVRVRLTR